MTKPRARTEGSSGETDEGELAAEAQRALDVGDFARVNELGVRLSRSTDATRAETGRAFVQKVARDPVTLAIFAAAVLFFVLITIRYVF